MEIVKRMESLFFFPMATLVKGRDRLTDVGVRNEIETKGRMRALELD